MKRLPTLFLTLVLLLTLCACGGGVSATSDSPAPSPSPSESAAPAPSGAGDDDGEPELSLPLYEYASGLPGGGAAIKVNGVTIPNEIYFHWLNSYCGYIDYSYSLYGMTADFTDPELAEHITEAARNAVVYFASVYELAEQNGIAVTQAQQADLQAQLDSLLDAQDYDMDTLLRSRGLSEDGFYYVNNSEYLLRNLKDALVGEPDEGDLARYAADKNIFACKHILLKTVTDDVTGENGSAISAEDYNASRRSLAEDLLAQLRAAGSGAEALLDQLAEEYSEDGRRPDGHLAAPEGYTFDDDDSLVPGFREGTLAVEIGALTDIVETSYGYHIILRLPVDPSEYDGYHDEWQEVTLTDLVDAACDKADVAVAEALDAVDVARFHDRCSAWLTAFAQATAGSQPAE